MVVRGLLVIISGFLFIFAPGLPMGLLGRRTAALQRELIYWGIGLWLAALLPALFVQSVLRQLLQPAGTGAGQYFLALLGALVTALFVQAAMFLVLRRLRLGPAQVFTHGLPLGFGVGLVSQIFNGIGLVSAGVALLFGGASATGPAADLAAAGPGELTLTLVSPILFRLALLVVSAAQGVLVARAVTGERRLFWAAVLVDAVFAWGVVVVQQALAGSGAAAPALAAVALIVYYGLAFALAFGWLVRKMDDRRQTTLLRRATRAGGQRPTNG